MGLYHSAVFGRGARVWGGVLVGGGGGAQVQIYDMVHSYCDMIHASV